MEPRTQRLGLVASMAVVLGNIVGVMIFLTQGTVAKHLPWDGWVLAAWGIGGVLALLGALCMAELGAMMPEAGGDYVFIREAFGNHSAFLSGWTSVIITFPGSIAAMAVAICAYQLSSFVGGWVNEPVFALGAAAFSIKWSQVLALLIIVGLTWINAAGIRLAGWVQTTVTILPILLMLVAGVAVWFVTPTGPLPPAVDTASLSPWSGLWPAIVPIFFAYAGWNATAYIGSEVENPGRNLPLSMILGTLIAMGIYLVVTLVFLKGIPAASMPNVKGLVPFAALHRLFGPWAGQALNAVIALAVLGSLNATLLVGARISYAIAKQYESLGELGKLHPTKGTPARALWLQAGIAIVLVLSGQFDALVKYVSGVMMVFSSLAVASLVVLRKKQPSRERPYKMWGAPWTPALYIAFCAAVLVGMLLKSPKEVMWGALVTIAGIPVFAWLQKRSA